MKKYLIRSGMLPTDVFDAAKIIANNSIGGNVGNLIYAYSIYRTLMTEDVEFVPDYYRVNPSDAPYINENYDAYFIPLADAFRPDFENTLKSYTKLINRLTIPVYVIGVGVRIDFEPDFTKKNPYDPAVVDFVKAVLNRSAMIGVRGEFTSRYLTHLGFKEGIDHVIIGCPSMYANGRHLRIRDTEINENSIVTINSSKLSPNHVLEFIDRSKNEFKHHYFIPQWYKELKMIYLGGPNLEKPKPHYQGKTTDELYVQDRVRYFLNAKSWIDFIGEADFSFGARLHGNITATIAGTPSLIIPKDGRMRELTDYHALNYVAGNELTEQTQIMDLIEKSDFHRCEHVHEENFNRFIHFLNHNGIPHIYEQDLDLVEAPLDKQLQEIQLLPPVKSFIHCSAAEMGERFETVMSNVLEQKNERIVKLKSQVKSHQVRTKHLEGTLNRKAVRIALKTANLFSKKNS